MRRRAATQQVQAREPVYEGKFFRATDPKEEIEGKFFRRRVEWDAEDGGLTEVADDRLTSLSHSARAMRDGSQVICLTREEVRWLHGVTGELLALWESKGDYDGR